MKDREFNQMMETARREADQFFSQWKFAPYRKLVHRRIAAVHRSKEGFWHFHGKPKFIWVGLFIFMLLPSALYMIFSRADIPSSSLGIPITQQWVSLDNQKGDHWINFFRLKKPNPNQQSLLAVVWKLNPDGNYQMIYNSLFEDSDTPHPVLIMDFPGSSGKLALISSENRQQKYLHYRLIEYTNGTAKIYLEKDFVPNGRVEMRKGILVEQRTVPIGGVEGNHQALPPTSKMAVTYFVPYQIDPYGQVILSTDYVRLHKGEYLTLVGGNGHNALTILSEHHILQEIKDENHLQKGEREKQFYAAEAGKDYLKILPEAHRGSGQKLFIEVVDTKTP